MNEENSNLIAKTWIRAINPINKSGYVDGVADGQVDTFQSSFNIGYSQGLKFGLHLGLNGAKSSSQDQRNYTFNDARKINCQLCINGTLQTTTEKVDNLYNLQEENNTKYLK